MNVIVVILIVVMVVYLFFRNRIMKSAGFTVIFAVSLMLLPLAMSLIYVMAPEVQDASTLMIYAYVLTYVFACALGELCAMRPETAVRALSLAMSAVLLLVGCSNYRMANEAYFRTGLAFERVESYYNRIISKLESSGGWNYSEKFAIVGDFWPEKNILSSYDLIEGRFDDLEGLAIENGLFTSGSRHNFIREYLGIDAPYASENECNEIMKTEEYAEMAAFPEDDCVREINGIWIVKIK